MDRVRKDMSSHYLSSDWSISENKDQSAQFIGIWEGIIRMEVTFYIFYIVYWEINIFLGVELEVENIWFAEFK